MKKLLVPVIIILAIILIPPSITGSKAKQELDTLIELIAESPGYNASWESYNKGWFSSDAILTVSIDKILFDASQTGTYDVSLKLDAKHGLFLFSDTQTVGLFSYTFRLLDEQTEVIKQNLDYDTTNEFYLSVGSVDLTGNLVISDRLAAFSASEDGTELSFAGYTGNGTYSASQELNYTGVIGKLSIDKPETVTFNMSESELSLVADYSQLIASNLAPSTFSFTTGEIFFTTEEDGDMTIENLDTSGEIIIADDQKSFDMTFEASAAKGLLGDEEFQDFTANFGYNDISIGLYEAYISALEKVNNFEDPAQIFTPELTEQFLASGMGFSVEKLSITLPDGKFNSSLNITLPAQTDLTADAVFQNPIILTQALLANAKITMDEPLVQQIATAQVEQSIQQQIESQRAIGQEVNLTDDEIDALVAQSVDPTLAALVQQRFIQKNGSVYESNFSFKNGQATVNGQVIPLEALLQGAL
jgi:uncharacterized protein YdgA (DUF945 family)